MTWHRLRIAALTIAYKPLVQRHKGSYRLSNIADQHTLGDESARAMLDIEKIVCGSCLGAQ